MKRETRRLETEKKGEEEQRKKRRFRGRHRGRKLETEAEWPLLQSKGIKPRVFSK